MPAKSTSEVRFYGVRHHGPGCARSLGVALAEFEPDAVLIEGPADATGVIPHVASEDMVPPVALLVYPVGEPGDASFYPFTTFSPEWVALRWALARGVPVSFMDLPLSARDPSEREPADEDGDDGDDEAAPPVDPIGKLAEAAGYPDGETWWDHAVERRQSHAGLFDAITEAMTAVRQDAPTPPRRELLREAHMRAAIRQARRSAAQRIAVISGAWHVPALLADVAAKDDKALLKDLPKRKTAATWIPWTNSRLSYRSGYGAGVESPGWYAHLWNEPDAAHERWIALAARLLREEDLDASSASVIEAIRLADALAAMRDMSGPGLAELREAIQTVLCMGATAPLDLVRDRLEIGAALGRVPTDVDTVPLQKDLEAQQKQLRMKPSAEVKAVTLDLRKEQDLKKSRLFYRLGALGIDWGELQAGSGQAGAGTFKEVWRVVWQPELAVRIIEANVFGHTVEAASSNRLVSELGGAEIGQLTDRLETAVLAHLPAAVDALLVALQAQATRANDVVLLAGSLRPLANLLRYGDVRGTAPEGVAPILRGIFERMVVALPLSARHIDEDAARRIAQAIADAQATVSLLEDAGLRASLIEALEAMLKTSSVHGLVRGKACRALLDFSHIDDERLTAEVSFALSRATDPLEASSWLEGLVEGGGLALLHHDAVWGVLDAWLNGLSEEAFVETVPLLRRAFSGFGAAEKRRMGEKIRSLGRASPGAVRVESADVDHDRARQTLPILRLIMGGSDG